MDDGFSQAPNQAPASNGVYAQDDQKPPLVKIRLAGRRITAIGLGCALAISVVVFRPVSPDWQLSIERFLIYLAPVLTLVLAYFLSQRAHQAGTNNDS